MPRLGDDPLGAEHVPLRILENEEGMAVRILGRMGLSGKTLTERLFEVRRRAGG